MWWSSISGCTGIDGIEVCRELRTFSDAYVVMLTARSEEVDTIVGLSVGADDYMSKPFSPREFGSEDPRDDAQTPQRSRARYKLRER